MGVQSELQIVDLLRSMNKVFQLVPNLALGFESVQARLKNMEDSIETIQQRIETMSGTVSALDAKIADLQDAQAKDSAALQALMSQADQNFTLLQQAIAAGSAAGASDTQLAAIQAVADKMRSDADAANARVAADTVPPPPPPADTTGGGASTVGGGASTPPVDTTGGAAQAPTQAPS